MNLAQLYQRLRGEGIDMQLSMAVSAEPGPERLTLACAMGEILIHKRVMLAGIESEPERNSKIDWAVASLVASTLPHYFASEQLKRDASNQQS